MKNNSTSLIYTTSKESLQAQFEQRSSLEAKASTLTAFAGGIFALLMGARETLISLPEVSKFFILVSIILFGLSVLLCSTVSWVRRYYILPNLEILLNKYVSVPEEETKLQLISNLTQEWKENHKKLENVAWFLRGAFVSQTIAFILLGISLYLSII